MRRRLALWWMRRRGRVAYFPKRLPTTYRPLRSDDLPEIDEGRFVFYPELVRIGLIHSVGVPEDTEYVDAGGLIDGYARLIGPVCLEQAGTWVGYLVPRRYAGMDASGGWGEWGDGGYKLNEIVMFSQAGFKVPNK